MKSFRKILFQASAALLTAMALAGCVTPLWQAIPAGTSRDAVQARLGTPREIYQRPDGVTRWLYPTWPYGQHTIAVDIDVQGRVLDAKDVLTTEEFNKAVIGKWTEHDVLTHFGKPEETAYFPRMQREVWSYRFKQDNVWDSLMHFYFDPQGVLRSTQVTPDPLYERERHGLF